MEISQLRGASLTQRGIQTWLAITLLASGLALATPAGVFGPDMAPALAWIFGGWFLQTLRLGYVLLVPSAKDQLGITVAVMWVWLVGGTMALTQAQGLLLLVAMPLVWRAAQRSGARAGLGTVFGAWAAVTLGSLLGGYSVSWISASAVVLGMTALLAVFCYGMYAHHLQLERSELKQIVSRQRVAARKMRMQDPDTGLANRRSLILELNRAKARQVRDGREFLVLLVRAPDMTMRDVGASLSDAARTYDPIGRVGMGDYVWIVRETDSALKSLLIERVMRAFDDQDAVVVTAIEGSAGADAEQLLRLAVANLRRPTKLQSA